MIWGLRCELQQHRPDPRYLIMYLLILEREKLSKKKKKIGMHGRKRDSSQNGEMGAKGKKLCIIHSRLENFFWTMLLETASGFIAN